MKITTPNSHGQLTKLTSLILLAMSSYSLDSRAALNVDEKNSSNRIDFDPIFLNGGNAQKVDITRFSNGNVVEPGEYTVGLFVNDHSLGNASVSFINLTDSSVSPCMKKEMLAKLGVNVSALSPNVIKSLAAEACLPLKEISSQIGYQFDYSEQRLNITIPQTLMQNQDKSYVSPELWENGITAGMLGYNTNFYTTRTQGTTTNSTYAGINSGFNILGWNLRHNGSYNWSEQDGGHYDSINTYVQHDIIPLKGRVTLGENNTNGQVFDSLPFRGAELQDDERMLPASERGYAPEIRGIAKTNAKVTVRQNNLVIYETTVAPGAFAIKDVYPSGYGSNLTVTVTEADGSLQTFEVPFASINQLLRPDAHHYNFVVGRYNENGVSESPLFYQATYQRGLSNLITAYGGAQYSENYLAVQAGVALNTSLGAIALDATQANAKFHPNNDDEDDSSSGQSYRFSYSKYVSATDSNFAIAAYRFSTSGYLDFRNAMQTIQALDRGDKASSVYRPKNRISLTANQGLPEGWGQLYISGYAQDYWNADSNSDVQYQIGYSTTLKTATLGLNASRTRNGYGDMETSFMFTISMPLGSAMYTPQFNGSFTRDGQGNTGEQIGISGSMGKNNQFSYGLSASDYSNSSASGNISGQYLSPFTRVNANYGAGKDYSNATIGLTGSLLGYSGGVIMTPYISDSFAIIEAKGATGASIATFPGTSIDRWGHAAVPYLNPYQINEVSLDPKGMSDEAELQSSSQTIVPQAGAIVKVKYQIKQGYPILMNVSMPNGDTLPFGAEIFNSSGESVGVVGQCGQIYARVEKEKDTLLVQWGNTHETSCKVAYILPPSTGGAAKKTIIRFDSQCQ